MTTDKAAAAPTGARQSPARQTAQGEQQGGEAKMPLRGGDVSSVLEGLAWPAIPDRRRLLILSVLYQMERSERWSAERIRRYQFRQLTQLVRHAGRHVPFYRARFKESGFDPQALLTPETWRQIPLLTRTDIQENFTALQSESLPKSHGKLHDVYSSGSTGTPVRVRKSGLSQIFWHAQSARFHLWNGDDMSQKYGAIKTQKNAATARYPQGSHSRVWGTGFPFATGPAEILNLNAKTHEQAEWLSRVKPNYLLSYPSIFKPWPSIACMKASTCHRSRACTRCRRFSARKSAEFAAQPGMLPCSTLTAPRKPAISRCSARNRNNCWSSPKPFMQRF